MYNRCSRTILSQRNANTPLHNGKGSSVPQHFLTHMGCEASTKAAGPIEGPAV